MFDMATVLFCSILLLGGWLFLLSLRLKVLAKPASVWFGGTTLVSLLLGWSVAMVCQKLVATRTREAIVCSTAHVVFSFALLLNPQITVNADVDWTKVPKKAFVMINHTSWLDAIVFCKVAPLTFLPHCRTLLKSTLLDLPIGGAFFRSAGHFPVYFKKDDGNNWELDKERQSPVTQQVTEFLKSEHGVLTFFPEGAVNKSPETLLSFRRGAFSYPLQYDMPIFAFIMVGNEESWPLGGLPGNPADIDVKLFKICERPGSLPDDVRSAGGLAAHCQKIMQDRLDETRASRQQKSALAKKME
ncbi:acyltransferase [Diplonema papillatum]|nr:acyltransferase [Diplonema papillatum]